MRGRSALPPEVGWAGLHLDRCVIRGAGARGSWRDAGPDGETRRPDERAAEPQQAGSDHPAGGEGRCGPPPHSPRSTPPPSHVPSNVPSNVPAQLRSA